MYLSSPIILASCLALFTASTQGAVHPEKADLICHTSDLDACYPRIFEPTDEFQIIHDDQSIPPGLHVRMDMTTGLKEAKLYDPTADDESNAVQVIASDSGGESIGSASEEIPDIAHDAFQQVVLTGANEHVTGDNPHRKPMVVNVHHSTFEDTLREIASEVKDPNRVASLLESLHETVDDPYFGMELARDRAAVQALASFVALRTSHPSSGQAASVLGAAISNNAPANAALVAHQFTDEKPKSRQWHGSVSDAVRSALQLDRSEGEIDVTLMEPDQRHHLFLLSKIWQDPAQRSLLDMQRFISHFAASSAKETPEWDVMRGKLADLVGDNYAAGFRNYDDEPPSPAPSRSSAECDVLLNWFRAFERACDAWDGCRWSDETTEGGQAAYSDARMRVHEARRALGRVLTAPEEQGGCQSKISLEKEDERRLGLEALEKARSRLEKAEL